MAIDRGTLIDLESEAHEPVAQWQLRDHGPLDMAVQIQVGTVEGGWYVRHQGFSDRRFADKMAARQAVRGLMGQHEGRWERVEVDSGPFRALCRPDGSRVLYDTDDGESLHASWGRSKTSAGPPIRPQWTRAKGYGKPRRIRFLRAPSN